MFILNDDSEFESVQEALDEICESYLPAFKGKGLARYWITDYNDRNQTLVSISVNGVEMVAHYFSPDPFRVERYLVEGNKAILVS